MAYCSHCGELVQGGRFCAACGKPITPEAVEQMTAEFRRHQRKMYLVLAAIALVFPATVALIVSRGMHTSQAADRPHTSTAASAPAPQQQRPPSTETAGTETSQDQTDASPVDGIDTNAVQNALATISQQEKRSDASPQPASSVGSSGSDRYPESQAVEVKDANLPDIGVPVASEVYTTTDSVSTVMSYYTQRYPDAQVTEINGQKIIAVTRPKAMKVIAIGTTGSETRIAIVRPVN